MLYRAEQEQLVCLSGNQRERRITMKPVRRTLFLSFGALVILSVVGSALAQTSRERNTKKAREAANQSAKAARVFDQIMGTREQSIPGDLLVRAEAVAVYPTMFKTGFRVGGRGGIGVIIRRLA